MDLREQVLQFRSLLEESGFDIGDFELNVDGDAFRGLMAGGNGHLEVRSRTTGVAITYNYDGTPAWLENLAADLGNGTFSNSG